MQQISWLERQLAGEFHDGDAAVNGVDVDDADCAGCRCDLAHQVIVGFDNQDCRMIGATIWVARTYSRKVTATADRLNGWPSRLRQWQSLSRPYRVAAEFRLLHFLRVYLFICGIEPLS